MRKTKLIILPTKCLNRMGFLLLFLSCPVIGDWGRIRPDTEMSQWSILLDKEGSCGLIRNSRQSERVPDGHLEYQEVGGGTPLNDTPPTTGNFVETERSKPEAFYKIQRKSERRIARREVREGRTVSAERRDAFRRIENSNRNYRTIPQEYTRRNDVRRFDRRVRNNNEVIRDNTQKRQERDSGLRRIDSRVESRRMEKRRLSRRIENNDATTRRVTREMRRLSRAGVGNAERQEYREDRRAVNGERRSSEREVFESRRQDNAEGRLSSRRVETRRDTSKERVSDGRRTLRRLAARREQSGSGMRRDAVIADTRRNERSFERREALQKEETRRFVVDFARKQDVRAAKYQRREFLTREKTARIDRYMEPESRIAKQKNMKAAEDFKWEFPGGLKNWFHQNTNRESWMVNNNFAVTCLVGATVYLLTTRQIKAV